MGKYPPEAVSLLPCPKKGVVKLAPGEFMIKCPFNLDHIVLNGRFDRHLEKCRRNYRLRYADRKEPPFKVCCKYNPNHEVYAPEIIYHEHGCTDKHRLVLEYLLMDRKKINSILKGNFNPEDYSWPETESDSEDEDYELPNKIQLYGQLYTGIDLDELAWDLVKAGSVDALSPPPPKAVEDSKVFWADPAIAEEKGISPFKPDKLMKISQAEDPPRSRLRVSRRQPCQEPLKKLESVAEVEEDVNSEAYWEKMTGKGFDWLEHQFTYKPSYAAPMNGYPPGLTKSQRRKFVAWNAERMKLEHGIFREE